MEAKEVTGTYNLAQMEQDVIAEAYRRYPNASHYFIADKLGISIGDLWFKTGCKFELEFNLEALERRLIDKAFALHGRESVKAVAKSLGVSDRTIFRRMEEWGESKRRTSEAEVVCEELTDKADVICEYNLLELEKQVISTALCKYPDKTLEYIAESILGISYRTLYSKIDKLGLQKIREEAVLNHRNKNKQKRYSI